MKEKKVLGKGNRLFLFIIQQVVAVIAAVCVAAVAIGSFVSVSGGFARYDYFLNPFSYDMEFEESDIFRELLQNGIRDAVRMSVIKSQLETDGEFDGNKEIDVTAYVNRAEQLSGNYVTANYRLEDLLKWGKYGLEYTGKVFNSMTEMYEFLAEFTTYTQYEGTYTTGFHPVKDAKNGSPTSWQTENGNLYQNSMVMIQGITEAERNAEIEYWQHLEQSETPDASAAYTEAANMQVGEEILAEGAEGMKVQEYTATDDTVTVTYVEDSLHQTILSNRYETVDGKTPEELVASWEEYYELCGNIAEAANSLYYNYQEYLNYENSYSLDNSNLLYCMEMLVDGENVYFTNAALKDYREATINHFFEGYKKNIYYSPYDMEYHTNTEVTEEYFLILMDEYNYAYTENTKIWIAVDDKYSAEDVFAKANYSYRNFLPYWWEYVGGAIVCVGIYILILIAMSVLTGREEIEDETGEETEGKSRVIIRLTKFERIPTEIWLLICGMIAGLLFIMLWFTFDMLSVRKMDSQLLLKITAVETVMVSSAGSLLFYSFVRRCKGHNLWNESFTCHILKWTYRNVFLRVAEALKLLYKNMPVALRTIVPYGLFVAGNVLVTAFAVRYRDLLILVFLGAADAFAGWLLFRMSVGKKEIVDGIEEIRDGDLNYQINAAKFYGENKILAEAVNSIGEGIRQAVETSMKDERLKADLITNVSHDIKTPLTSIINYVDLLKREDIQDKKVKNYIQVLDSKSQRLKQLTEDLVEASKISSGNITLHIEKINIVELLNQAIGEFSEKFDMKDLQMVVAFENKIMFVEADSRRMWRVIENLFNNIFKYAMPGTRVYIDGKEVTEGKRKKAVISVKNISAQPLNINADELTERFIRGDVSRSTEGSGLGLSIAKSLTEAQNGNFEIYLDGDLFKAILTFPEIENKPETEDKPE